MAKQDPRFPREFKCKCGATETVSQAACKKEKDEGKIPPEVFTSLEKVACPLIGSRPPVGLTVPALMAHYDICMECGAKFCTRVEIIQMPISMKLPGTGGMPGPMPGGQGFAR